MRRPRSIRIRALEALEDRTLLTVVMSPQEQLILELVNRARADPAAEAERFEWDLNEGLDADEQISTDPKQPLAPHQALTDAAGLHSDDMLRRNYFGHDSPEGVTPSQRAMDAGYPRGAGENIAWAGEARLDRDQEVYDRHQGLFESSGHRVNMMLDRWREIGAGVRYGTFTKGLTELPSIMVGTLFGNRGGNHFITGVVISDHIRRNDFYEMGEGLGDISLVATAEGSDETYSDVSGPTGGYGIQVPDGIYTVTASGAALPNPITVRGVQVDGANVKLDFNRRFMNLYFVDGTVFADHNGNGRRGAGEEGREGETVYFDVDDNDTLDVGEPRALTDEEGYFRFEGLQAGEYELKLSVPERQQQTFPEDSWELTIEDRNLVGALFGISSQNLPPEANDDVAAGRAGDAITIAVLTNDTDPDDALDPGSVRIVTPPSYGHATVSDTGDIVYRAQLDHVGPDALLYTVQDTDGTPSNAATVTIDVTPALPWHNRARPLDVNNDDFIISQDALIVIREINRIGAGSLEAREREEGAPYYDVNGDNYLTALDALRIIRFLNAQAAGEPPTPRQADAFFALAAMDDEENERLSV